MVRALPYVCARSFWFSRVVPFVVLSVFWIAAGGFLASATRASAQDIYTVTVTTDDATGVAANCPANGSGANCSLRDAIQAANTDSSGSAIAFAVTGTITVVSSPIVISPGANLTITGPGENQLTISGGNAVTPFGIATSATVSISGVTFAQGYDAAFFNGGAIVIASGTVQIANSAFVGNSAVSGYSGGAIYNSGNLTLNGDTFQGNSASNGGAVYNGGALAVVGCTFQSNAASYGGGVDNNNGTTQIINSTFSTNSASAGGALFNNSGATLTVSDSTFATNAASPGVSISDTGGALTVSNSIVTGTTDCSGAGCPLNGSNGNVVGDPNVSLSALENWGGPTQTFLPLSPSSTHCAGSSSLLPTDPTTGATLNDDQRGFPINTACVDAGAVQTNYMTVATTNDTFNSGSSCTGAAISCSLRDAVYLANQAGFGDINFAQGLSGSISMSPVSAVEPTGEVNIIGPGANVLTIAGDGTDPVFVVTGQANISGLTITGGANPGGTGGGVLDSGNLTLSNVLVTGNAATGGSGGGIWVNALPASLTLNNSTVANNTASEGGGLYASGPATINESTIATNTATDTGGGIFNNTGPMVATNTTVSANTAGRDAGGLYQNAPFTLFNSIVSGNTAPAGVDTDGTVAYTASSSQISNPLATLAVLGNYGGATPTMIPLPGSAAICAGSAALLPAGITTDQRGYANVNTAYTGSACVDAGAVQTNYTGVVWTGATQVGSAPSTPTYYGNATSPIGPPAVTPAIVDNGVNSVPGIPVILSVSGPATATITTNPVTTSATGAAFAVTPSQAGTYTASISPITVYGSYAISANPAASLVISAAGTATVTAVNPVFAGLGAGSATLSATVSPISGGATVNEGSVSFTVSGPGGAMGSVVSAPVSAGTASVIFTIPAGTAAGAYTITAQYSDTAGPGGLYLSSNGTGTLTIGKATPTVYSWPTASVITYGQTLASSTLSGGTASVAGTFAFTVPATAPVVGTASQSVTFTPTDTTDYNTVTGNVSVTVNKGTATVTAWPTASAITYGQTLASSTLNGGTASVPGTFAFTTPTTAPAVGTASQSVTFTPTDSTDYSSVAGSVSVTVNRATPTVSAWPTASAITYGQTLASSTLTGGTASVPGTVAFTTPSTVPPAGTAAQSVTFTPTDTADYQTVTATVIVTVNKATVTVTNWPTATVITYGQTLSSSTLVGGTASVPGAFAFTSPTTAPPAGTASQSVTFAPADTADYNSVTGSVSVTVNKATATVTAWPAASAITYGQTLASSTLTGGTSSVPGTFAFAAPATAPPAGTATQNVTFTPTDSANYNSVAGSVSVTVNKATPTVTAWPAASPISYGQTLASSTLSGGTASVPGTFTFTAPATAPAAGTALQSVTFAPTDSANYNTAAGSVSVTVNKATATVTLGNLSQTYTGSPLAATATTAPAGLSVTFTYDGSSTAPTAVGSYSVIGTINDANYSGSATGALTINKATATLTLGNLAQTYTGSPLSATATTTPAGLSVTFTYNGSSTAPTAAGSYGVLGSISNPNYAGSASGTLVITKAGLTLSAQASPANAVYGGTVTLAGTAIPAITEATGSSFSFIIDAGTANALTVPAAGYQSGAASAADAALKAGPHTVTLSFTGTSDYSAANSASVAFVIGQASPTVVWSPATSISYGTTLAGLLNASASANGQPVAGSWNYTAQPAGGTAAAVNASTVLGAGNYTLTAVFTPADSVDYKTASSASSLSVVGSTLTVSANDATRVYGTPNPTFSGAVTGAANGDSFTESFTTAATASSNAGKYLIVPSASGPNLGYYTVVVKEGTLTVTQAGTATSLSASASSINPGASVTLSAIVIPATTGTPTGTISFYAGSTLLGTATLSGGSASYSTTALPAGATDAVTAVYSGDINFTSSSTTASTPITVAPLDFTLTAGPASQAGAAGNSFTYQVTVDPMYGAYAGTVNFAASGLPSGATASFSPSSLAANAGKQTVSMAINTSATSAAAQEPAVGRKLGTVALAFLFLPLFGARGMRRQGRRLGGFVCLLLLALAGVAATATLTGCGAQLSPVKTQQSYTVTITATSGNIQHASTVTLELH